MSLSLNKNNSIRSNRFLFLTLYRHNFLTLFSRGGILTALTLNDGNSSTPQFISYTTKAFNQQVKNNIEKFDTDFRFQLTKEEYNEILRSKNLTSKEQKDGRKYLPFVFTEQGFYMLMTVEPYFNIGANTIKTTVINLRNSKSQKLKIFLRF